MSAPKHTPGYEVTTDGEVFSLLGWRGEFRRRLAVEINKGGYPCVRVRTVYGKRKRIPVHRLVAAEHLPPQPSPAHEVRHLDGNRLNPRADNLAWGTRAENAADRERHGRTSRGERHSRAIRASNQAEGTRRFRASQRLAQQGVSQ